MCFVISSKSGPDDGRPEATAREARWQSRTPGKLPPPHTSERQLEPLRSPETETGRRHRLPVLPLGRSLPCQCAHSLRHPGFSGTRLCIPCSPPMAFTSLAPPLRARHVPARRGAAAATCTAPPAGPPVSRRTALVVAAAGLLAVGLGGPALPVAAYSSRTQNDMSNASPTRYVAARQ